MQLSTPWHCWHRDVHLHCSLPGLGLCSSLHTVRYWVAESSSAEFGCPYHTPLNLSLSPFCQLLLAFLISSAPFPPPFIGCKTVFTCQWLVPIWPCLPPFFQGTNMLLAWIVSLPFFFFFLWFPCSIPISLPFSVSVGEREGCGFLTVVVVVVGVGLLVVFFSLQCIRTTDWKNFACLDKKLSKTITGWKNQCLGVNLKEKTKINFR